MDTITVDGVEYIKTSKAARQTGYTADYVGQLCRKGALDAIVLGKTWYVSSASLFAHKDSQRRTNIGLTRRDIEQQKHTIRTVQGPHGNNSGLGGSVYHERLSEMSFRYASDTSELLPAISRPMAPQDAPAGADTAVFVRRLLPESHGDVSVKEEPQIEEIEAASSPAVSERYDQYPDEEEKVHETGRASARNRFWLLPALTILLAVFSTASFLVESIWQYTAVGTGEFVFNTSYTFASVNETAKLLRDSELYTLK